MDVTIVYGSNSFFVRVLGDSGNLISVSGDLS